MGSKLLSHTKERTSVEWRYSVGAEE